MEVAGVAEAAGAAYEDEAAEVCDHLTEIQKNNTLKNLNGLKTLRLTPTHQRCFLSYAQYSAIDQIAATAGVWQ